MKKVYKKKLSQTLRSSSLMQPGPPQRLRWRTVKNIVAKLFILDVCGGPGNTSKIRGTEGWGQIGTANHGQPKSIKTIFV